MLHQRVELWEENLNELLKRVDLALEEKYGDVLAPHPARPPHGSTANPQHDGLFRVTASFTPGFGSELGKGYVLSLELVTLRKAKHPVIEEIQKEAVTLIQEGLEGRFPGKKLKVKRDGNLWKIIGDLSL